VVLITVETEPLSDSTLACRGTIATNDLVRGVIYWREPVPNTRTSIASCSPVNNQLAAFDEPLHSLMTLTVANNISCTLCIALAMSTIRRHNVHYDKAFDAAVRPFAQSN